MVTRYPILWGSCGFAPPMLTSAVIEVRLKSFKFLATVVLTISGLMIVSAGCGGGGGSSLEKTLSASDRDYCDEVNRNVTQALSTHYTKRSSDLPELYHEVFLQIVEKNCQSGFMFRDSCAELRKQIYGESKRANSDRLPSCADFSTMKDFLNTTGLDHFSPYAKQPGDGAPDDPKDNPRLFRIFMEEFVHALDPHSEYVESGGVVRNTYGLRFDDELIRIYGMQGLESLTVGTAAAGLPIHRGDKIMAVSIDAADLSEARARGILEFRYQQVYFTGEKSIADILKTPYAGYDFLDMLFTHSPFAKMTVIIERDGKRLTFPLQGSLTLAAPLVASDMLPNGILYARLYIFMHGAAQELRDVITAANIDRSAPLKGIILDLRFNPGGELGEAEGVLAQFLNPKDQNSRGYAIWKTRAQEEVLELKKLPGDQTAFNQPLIVLINHASASASELTSMVLQDTGRALIIGEQSFGKGTGQTIEKGDSGGLLHGAMKLTTAQFFGPEGESTQMGGVHPQLVASALTFSKALKACEDYYAKKLPDRIYRVREKDFAKVGFSHWVVPPATIPAMSSPIKISAAESWQGRWSLLEADRWESRRDELKAEVTRGASRSDDIPLIVSQEILSAPMIPLQTASQEPSQSEPPTLSELAR